MNCKWCDRSLTLTDYDKECVKCLLAKGPMNNEEFSNYIVELARTTIFKEFLKTYSKKD